MKVVFHEDFKLVYTVDPAASAGRMEAMIEAVKPHVECVAAQPAMHQQIAAVHAEIHIRQVERQGLYEIAALAAGSGRLPIAMPGAVLLCWKGDTIMKCLERMYWR